MHNGFVFLMLLVIMVVPCIMTGSDGIERDERK